MGVAKAGRAGAATMMRGRHDDDRPLPCGAAAIPHGIPPSTAAAGRPSIGHQHGT
ncbi:hypothetical protein OH687_23020 [Burkholderia anthina]|nr:hypothetical protein OH687_23020 [Burkholderia anthina]